MIPIIGLIVGVYCFVRLLEVSSRAVPIGIRIAAVAGAVAIVLLEFALLSIHTSTP